MRFAVAYPGMSSAWLWWSLWIISFSIYSAFLPRDATFDVAHYHLHNGWSALNGRLAKDLAPAEMHSFFNPLYQIGVWWLVDHMPGPAVSAILGAVQAFSLPVLFYLGRNLLERTQVNLAWPHILVLAMLGFTAIPHSDLYASIRNDWLFALAFLAALNLLFSPGKRGPANWRLLVASLLVGFSFGTKLTNLVYVAAFAVAVMTILPGVRRRIEGAAICAGGGLSGIAMAGGVWAWVLWHNFGNPAFPMLDGLFHSSDGPGYNFRDERYLPDSFLDGVLLPLRFLLNGELIHEASFFDPRFLLAWFSGLGLLVASGMRAVRAHDAHVSRQIVALSASVLSLIIIWTAMFSIQRYALVVWMLGPLMLILLLATLTPSLLRGRNGALCVACLALPLLLFSESGEVRRNYWKSIDEPYVWANVPETLDLEGSVILMAGEFPTAFLAPFLPESAVFAHAAVQPWSSKALGNYQPRIAKLLTQTDRPVFAVILDFDNNMELTLSRIAKEFGYAAKVSCVPIRTAFDNEQISWKICPLEQAATN